MTYNPATGVFFFFFGTPGPVRSWLVWVELGVGGHANLLDASSLLQAHSSALAGIYGKEEEAKEPKAT